MSKSTNDAVRFSNSEFRAFIIKFCCRLNLTEARLVTMASLVLLQANLLFSKEFPPVTIAELPQYFAESKGKYLKVRSQAEELLKAAAAGRVNARLGSTTFDIRRGKPFYIFPTEEKKNLVIQNLTADLNKSYKHIFTPVLPFKDKIEVGQIGTLNQPYSKFKVIQVVGPNAAIVKWEKEYPKSPLSNVRGFHPSMEGLSFGFGPSSANPANGKVLDTKEGAGGFGYCIFWLTSNTTGMVDGKEIDPQGVYEVASTRSYESVAGGTKTIFEFRGFDFDKLMPEPELPVEDNAPTPMVFPLRDWVDSTGNFKIKAQFVGVEDRSVALRKIDGEIVNVDINKLSKTDRDHIVDILAAGSGMPHPPNPNDHDARDANDVSQGLISYYTMDNSLQDLLNPNESLQNINHSFGVDRFGKSASCLTCSLGDDNENAGVVTSFLGPVDAKPRTVSCWVQTTVRSPQEILSYGSVGGAGVGDKFQLFLSYGETGVTASIGNSAITYRGNVADGNWHHLVFVLPDVPDPRTKDITIYLDSKRISTAERILISLNPNQSLRTGKSPLIIGGRFEGSIDELRIYDRPLNEQEIANLQSVN